MFTRLTIAIPSNEEYLRTRVDFSDLDLCCNYSHLDNNINHMKYLIENGTDVNEQDFYGLTTLMYML